MPGEWITIADLRVAGEKVLVAKGGRGGLGNAMYVSATNRSPRKVQPVAPVPGLARRLG